MNFETRNCQNCNRDFMIESDDVTFYETVQVSSPTFCPDCRAQRRMLWRCERNLYKRNCGLCKKPIISIYSTDKPFMVYCHDCFHGDGWDPLSYGMEVDFSKPFLSQFRELQLKVPRQYAFVFQNVKSDYTNGSAFNKNCYLLFVSDHNEDCQYSYSTFNSRNSMDLLNCNECELCYECVTCKKCYRVYFSEDCANSQNLYFCKNCVNCQDCVGSANLRSKRYCIFNQEYSKEEYQKKLKEMGCTTRSGLAALESQARAFWPQFPLKYIHGFQNTNVVGDYTFNSKNTFRTYDSELLENCKYINHGNKAKDSYDSYVIVDNSQNCYEAVGGLAMNNVKFSVMSFNNFDIDYADGCESSNNLFGCCGLRRKQYCVLNKEYSREEYIILREKIIRHMNDTPYTDSRRIPYRYGEFFPPAFSPFAYNETVAQEYFPLAEGEAARRDYLWKPPEHREYKIDVPHDTLPDAAPVDASLASKVIGCVHEEKCNHGCTLAFRLTPAEMQLYVQAALPVPTLCFNCRHFARLGRRNALRLYERSCACAGEKSANGVYRNTGMHAHGKTVCTNTFQTTCAPEKLDIVYCEECYQQEVV